MASKSTVVILIPGIFDLGWSMLAMQRALRAAGFSPHYLHLKYNSGWRGMEFLSHQLKQQVDALLPQDHSCALVGFSMGGIVARHYLQLLGGAARVHKFIAISSPHYGSLLAHLLPYRGGRQLCIHSDFLEALNRDMDILASTAPVSIWTPYDITIVPHHSSRLPLGSHYQFPVRLHRWMPGDGRVIAAVTSELCAALSHPADA